MQLQEQYSDKIFSHENVLSLILFLVRSVYVLAGLIWMIKIAFLFFGFCRTVSFGEYECYGPGADSTGRVAYGKQLRKSEAAQFLDISFIDGEEWLLSGGSRNSLHLLDIQGDDQTNLVQIY